MQLSLLDQPPSSPSPASALTFPSGVTIRTLIEGPPRYLMDDYRPNHFAQTDASGGPFNECHSVYLSGSLQGTIYRLTPNTPWHIAATAVIDARVHGFDFDQALADLIAWHQRNQQEMRDWLKSFSA